MDALTLTEQFVVGEPKLILAAAMRKLLQIAFGVLKSGQPFNPSILAKIA